MMGNISKPRREPKTRIQKIWHFIWYEDSWASWTVNIVLAFLLIKFIVYPGLGFLLASSHPVVAVVSGSMYHGGEHPCTEYYTDMTCKTRMRSFYEICGVHHTEKVRKDLDSYWESCGGWYEDIGIEKDVFGTFPMSRGFQRGDIIVLYGRSDIEVGDVIVFQKKGVSVSSYPIIHRVVDIEENDGMLYYQTKGDHNKESGDFERGITQDMIIGKALVKIPYLGYVKIIFVDAIRYVVGIFV